MIERTDMIMDFLCSAGWDDARLHALPGDASTRRYYRIISKNRHAMLMDQPQNAESPPAPPNASETERRSLGYNAVARLAGADCARFIAISEYLCGRGLSAPRIYAADSSAGFVLMEDFGDRLYSNVLANGKTERDLYTLAVDALVHLHAVPAPERIAAGIHLFPYDQMAMLAETDLLTEWYLPLVLHRNATAHEITEHREIWRALLAKIECGNNTFVLRDYHAQNLLWLEAREGVARVGLIDFQDAVAGSPAYDLVSLIEDARREVSPELASDMIAHYLLAMREQGTAVDEEPFRAAVAIMAAQRNAKIAGIFARLHLRDGKSRYLSYLPRVWGYLRRDLNHPSLAPLKAWYERVLPSSAREGRIEGWTDQ